MAYGCRYCKMDMMRQEEYCILTGELTKSAVMCDFGYEQCPEYKKAQEPIKPKRQAKTTLMQTSIFGASGEKVFKG